MTATRKTLRCAVYTRKSSEEGLEQDFNSLEAQREACEAYIKSQAHEGWRLSAERFDDGGFSGGSLERPALKRLLDEVRDKQIDVIVIYKIDRLTRSLMDFAKLADLFEKQGVSFVSVTQQFNTTTSMGRLMLNVLLSFAQFEREITGERIRDKIAASKKKGIWMGGSVPAGYDVKDRALVINEQDAKTVRMLFRLYAELGSVRKVWAEAQRLKFRTPVRTSTTGQVSGGKPFDSHNLYHLLSSPIYNGKLPHKGQVYDGKHPPLITPAQWKAVQDGLAGNRVDRRYGRNHKNPSPLAGLLFDAKGVRFTPTHTRKGAQRYRYYVDPALTTGMTPAKAHLPRIPALEIEHAVRKGIAQFLRDPETLLGALSRDVKGPAAERALKRAGELAEDILDATPQTWMPLIGSALTRIMLAEDAIALSFDPLDLRALLSGAAAKIDRLSTAKSKSSSAFEYRIPVQMRSRKGAMRVVIAAKSEAPSEVDPVLLRTIAKAHVWAERLRTSEVQSVRDIAKEEGVTPSFVARMLRVGFLPPSLVEMIAQGNQPTELTIGHLFEMKVPLRGNEQVRDTGGASWVGMPIRLAPFARAKDGSEDDSVRSRDAATHSTRWRAANRNRSLK